MNLKKTPAKKVNPRLKSNFNKEKYNASRAKAITHKLRRDFLLRTTKYHAEPLLRQFKMSLFKGFGTKGLVVKCDC